MASGMATVMRAIQIDEPGGQVRLADVTVPAPAPGEALIEVHAAALTAGERAWPERWPATLSHEVSGIVVDLGPGTTGLEVGQPLFGLVGFDLDGAAAEYVTAPAADLATKPASIEHVSAASMALSPLTAWQALVDHAHLMPGQHVLVNGAAGGVGSYTVQLAHALGGRVTATTAPNDAEFVSALGADRVIDYSKTEEMPTGDVDIAIDLAGIQTEIWPAMRPGGIVIGIAGEPSAAQARRHKVDSDFFIVEPSAPELAELARLAEAGIVHPMVSLVFPLADAAAAIDAVDGRHTRGKVVLAVRA
jgi:NADPH:quinone reductase-like Zn-dependent oxidoreductase